MEGNDVGEAREVRTAWDLIDDGVDGDCLPGIGLKAGLDGAQRGCAIVGDGIAIAIEVEKTGKAVPV
ncbi:MAG: hypothetical protein IH921_12420 [Gemmatimonadetes bacterium]|nr:hypothetical protein [Gemmatimonadota bacterium]